MSNRTKAHRASKPVDTRPEKPYPGFPLFPHASGRWAKKINRDLHYFGRWGHKRGDRIVPVENVAASASAAKQEFDRQWPYISHGQTPPPINGSEDGFTIYDLVNGYLTAKRERVNSGEITRRTFGEYYSACGRVFAAFGRDRLVSDLTAADFGRLRAQLAKTRGLVALGNEIQRVRMLFKWGYDEGLIDRPIRYGQSFAKPSMPAIRKARANTGSRMFESYELRTILNALDGKQSKVELDGEEKPVTLAADPTLKAIVLLSINAGFGQWDIACLPRTALDFAGEWVTFPRPKTGVPRRAKLWSETVAAITAALAIRSEPASGTDAGLAFLAPNGKPWVEASTNEDEEKWKSRSDRLGKRFAVVLDRIGVNGRRGFYAIRHSFQTAAEDSGDFPAIRYIMGHTDNSMSAQYRERISDERLQAVAETVRSWLFPKKRKAR